MLQGYLLGSYMYLSIVFVVPLSLGVVAVALDLPLNTDEALEGLVMPASAYVLLGKGGQHSHCMNSSPGTRQYSRHSVSESKSDGRELSLGNQRPLWCLSCLSLRLSKDIRCSTTTSFSLHECPNQTIDFCSLRLRRYTWQS